MDIILVSTKENKRINLHLNTVFIILAVIAIAVVLILFVYNIAIFTSHKVDQKRLVQLNTENKIIRQEIVGIRENLSELSGLVDSLEQYDNRLRTYASLEPINGDLRKMGVGGKNTNEYSKLSSETRDDLIALSATLDNLLARSRLQYESYNTLISHLDKKQYLRDHTPSVIPVQGWFISGFGYRIDPFTGTVKLHEGLDIAAPQGTPIIAPADGIIKAAGERKGFGLTLEIDHGYGFTTIYAHCQRIKAEEDEDVVGKKVKRGEIIAYVGNTGRSTGPHLHYEVRVSKIPVDPLDYVLTISDTEE